MIYVLCRACIPPISRGLWDVFNSALKHVCLLSVHDGITSAITFRVTHPPLQIGCECWFDFKPRVPVFCTTSKCTLYCISPELTRVWCLRCLQLVTAAWPICKSSRAPLLLPWRMVALQVSIGNPSRKELGTPSTRLATLFLILSMPTFTRSDPGVHFCWWFWAIWRQGSQTTGIERTFKQPLIRDERRLCQELSTQRLSVVGRCLTFLENPLWLFFL